MALPEGAAVPGWHCCTGVSGARLMTQGQLLLGQNLSPAGAPDQPMGVASSPTDPETACNSGPFMVEVAGLALDDGASLQEAGMSVSNGSAELQIVKVDDGGVNARILARQAQADFRRIEAASVKMPVRFTSAEGKRLFVRMFNTLQLNTHFISVIARTRIDADEITRIELALRGQLEQVTEKLNRAIDEAEVLFRAHGITAPATYDALPLELDVHVLSSLSRRYLEVLGKLDQLMPLLQTLEIHEVLSAQQLDSQRAALKRQVRNVANGARSQATALRRRMNQMSRQAAGAQGQAVDGIDAEGQVDPNEQQVPAADAAPAPPLVTDGFIDGMFQGVDEPGEAESPPQAPEPLPSLDGDAGLALERGRPAP
jgi:hypothetical protein